MDKKIDENVEYMRWESPLNWSILENNALKRSNPAVSLSQYYIIWYLFSYNNNIYYNILKYI